MARPLRLLFENACYHVMARGIRRERIFQEPRDREIFLSKVEEIFMKYSAVCYAYCLMDNHYHLFMRTARPNLPQVMHYLNSSYTNWFRVKHEVAGPLFQGRYKSILVDVDQYATVLSAYIHLNPLKDNLVAQLEDYKWSSFNSYLGKIKSVEWLDTDFILSHFGRNRNAYRLFVYEQVDRDISKDVYQGCVLGDEFFVSRIKNAVQHEDFDNKEIPQSRSLRKEIDARSIIEVVSDKLAIEPSSLRKRRKNNTPRKIAVYLVSKYTPLSLLEVGRLFHMDYSAVSQQNRRFEKEMDENEETRQITKMILNEIEMSNVET